MNRIRTQIAGISSLDDALAAVDVHTGVENADGTFSREKARDFVRAAEAAPR